MMRLGFSVDAALLRELGERLVGQPHIALAELVKNAYDADATRVSIEFGEDSIKVVDDGDGMTVDDFENFWMRVGTPHKQSIARTRLERVPTGSKGIGRLAVQFLGSGLTIRTTSRSNPERLLIAHVDWAEARSGDLNGIRIDAEETNEARRYADSRSHGTEFVVSRLNQEWDASAIQALAQQVWQLQPPFRDQTDTNFRIDVKHPRKAVVRDFENGMRRNLDIWSARLKGRLLPRRTTDAPGTSRVRLLVEFAGEEPVRHDYVVAGSNLHHVDFEVRVFSLYSKQRFGVGVEDARRYLKDHGGIHVYDGNFRLPYYGSDTDWLKTEIDHSHRITRSRLLPDELQVENGLTNLPTMSRLYGVVNVDTTREWLAARNERRQRLNEYLQIQASRDRLVDNPSYRTLRDIVRYAIDFYAVSQTSRGQVREIKAARSRAPPASLVRIGKVVEAYRDRMPREAFDAITKAVQRASDAQEADAKKTAARMGDLGSAAIAGVLAEARLATVRARFAEIDGLIAASQRSTRGAWATADAVKPAIAELRWLFDVSGAANPSIPQGSAIKVGSVRAAIAAFAPLLRPIEVEDLSEADLRFPIQSMGAWHDLLGCLLLRIGHATAASGNRRVRVRSTVCAEYLSISLSYSVAREGRDGIAEHPMRATSSVLKTGTDPIELACVRLGARLSATDPDDGFQEAVALAWSH